MRLSNSDNVGQPSLPSWWIRYLVYGVMWLPVFGSALFFVPQFEPIFKRLREHDRLPELSMWLIDICRWNARWFYVPVSLFALVPLIADQAVIRYLRRRGEGARYAWLWITVIAMTALPVGLAVVFALLQPVFRLANKG